MPGTKSNNMTTEGSDWLPSIATENLCGFSSFEAPIEALLRNDLIPANNQFARSYMHVMQQNIPANTLKHQRARAIKSAFAICVLHDKSGRSPFDQIMGMVCTVYMDPETADLSDYADFIRDFMNRNKPAIEKAYNGYLSYISDAEGAINDSGYEFYHYMNARHPNLIAGMKQQYCAGIIDPNNEYRAREIDLIYIAEQLDCFKTVITQNLNNTPIRHKINIRGDLEIYLRNTGNHWEAARLTIDTPEINPAEDVSEMLASTTAAQNKHALLIVFGAGLMNQPKFSQLLADNKSEVARIAQQGDDYIARARRADELLDSNSPDAIAEVMRLFPR